MKPKEDSDVAVAADESVFYGFPNASGDLEVPKVAPQYRCCI